MKLFRTFLISLLLVGTIRATEYFSGSGMGSQRWGSGERDYTTGWINTLMAQINANPNLTASARANTLDLLGQLTVIASNPGTFGTFSRSVGGSSGTIMITGEHDYIVDVWHLPGTAYFVDLWLTAPSAPSNSAPTISWTSAPTTVASGQNYSVSAHGHDADGNLTQVNVWRAGVGFAFAGGGNGYDGDSGNPANDTGPRTIIYSANAVDSAGATSPTISFTVTINAPLTNRAPTISWNSTPGTVASGQGYSISAHGHDADGNLTQVNIWRDGSAFAFAGGGNGYDGDSGNASTDTGPRTVTYTANAVDSNGATSATISQTVTVAAVNRAPTIAWNSTPGFVASGQSYSISAHGRDADGNLTQVNVWRDGVAFAFAGGGTGFDGDSGNASSETGPRTVTYTANAVDSNGATSATISQTVTVAAANRAPSIAWNSTPGSVASGQSYSISAHGHDADGNLTQVNVWRDGVAFAFAGGGTGFDGDSGNASSDTGPRTVTYTANAVDSNGATSGTISQTVTIGSANRAPTIAWNTTPGTVASGQSYSVSAHGHDADGNLTQVNLWKNGVAFGFAGGGNGFDNDSANATSDSGPTSVTFTAQAVDSSGTTSATISQTVSISAPPNVSALIAVNPTTATAPGSATLTWSSTNATSVAVSGPGVSSSAGSGGQALSGLSAGTYSYSVTAQGAGGPVTRTAVFTVNAPLPVVSGSIAASPASGVEPLSPAISWNTANASSVAVSGPGISSAASSGSQIAAGLSAGTYVFTLTAQGNGGPIVRTVTVSVAAIPTFALTTSSTAGGSVTPGGQYLAGSVVTISASSDATHRFTGWTGDASGSAPSIALTIDRAKYAQANFIGKSPQTISFSSPGDRVLTAPSFSLDATASSGLPVVFAVLSGPATLSSGSLRLSGTGAVTIQATQAGDAYYLPAPPVSQTFNATSVPLIKYRTGTRTLLESDRSRQLAPLVIEKP